MLHVGTDLTAAVKTPESILKNKTQFTLMFPGKSMEQLDQIMRLTEAEQPSTINRKRLPEESEKSISKKNKELAIDVDTDHLVPDIETDDFIACLVLCAVLDPTSPNIKRRREFWRQHKPVPIKLDSKYLAIGINPSLSQASSSLVSNALAANAFSTGSLTTNAIKKSLENFRENMSMTNRNIALHPGFRNAASKNCKSYGNAIGGLRLSAMTDLSSINPNYHGLNHQYLTGNWHSPTTTNPSFYQSALTAVTSDIGLPSLPYTSSASMPSLAASITSLPGYAAAAGLNPQQQFRFATAAAASASSSNNNSLNQQHQVHQVLDHQTSINSNMPTSLIWPNIQAPGGAQQVPSNNNNNNNSNNNSNNTMGAPFQMPNIKLESPLTS